MPVILTYGTSVYHRYWARSAAAKTEAVMMSNYNTRPEASEILSYHGMVHLIRPRRTVEDLIKMEINPFL